MSWWVAGRPGRLCCDLRAQRRRTMSRRQRSTVFGVVVRRRLARRRLGMTSRSAREQRPVRPSRFRPGRAGPGRCLALQDCELLTQ